MIKKIKAFIAGLLILFSTFLIFRNWFSSHLLVSGDWVFYFHHAVSEISDLPAWDSRHLGMGGSTLANLWSESYLVATIRTSLILGWNWYEKIFWFWPYLLLGFSSGCSLYFYFFKSKSFALLAGVLYLTNTYALLLVGGAQMGIALSYASGPFGVIAFENFLKKLTLKSALIFSIVFSAIFLLDIRIGYILVWLFALRFLFELSSLTKAKMKKYLYLFPLSGCIILGLHAFWLLPTFLTHGEAIRQFGDAYTSKGAVQFFSFAKFENALGLLHPNWPENIFGLTHFMRPEFLILPLLAFSALFFVKKEQSKENRSIVFFALLALVGIFLAKGANDPFGSVYLWLFDHVPGFIMFRDPTKWYVFIALGYSLLIPFALKSIATFISQHIKTIQEEYVQSVVLLVGLCVILTLIWQALLGQLSGTFTKHSFPQDYTTFETFIDSQNNFARTLWVPQVQRFGFHSEIHPAINAYDFFNVASVSGVLDLLNQKNTENTLKEASIQYIIVPFDSQQELFLKDRKYDRELYQSTVQNIALLPYVNEISGFGHIHVFRIDSQKNHFWLSGQGNVSFTSLSTTNYQITIKDVVEGEKLVFTDSFDSFWQAHIDGKVISSHVFDSRFNSFALPKNGQYVLSVTYKPQDWVQQGIYASLITLVVTGILLFFSSAGPVRAKMIK